MTNVLTVEKCRLSFGLHALRALAQLPCKEAQDLLQSCTHQQLPAPGPGQTHQAEQQFQITSFTVFCPFNFHCENLSCTGVIVSVFWK